MTNAAADRATTPDLSVLILHGWQSRRPAGHWHRWLADELEALGHQVVYPQLPEPDEPVSADWLAAVQAGFDSLTGARRVVVAHSLGCLAWLHFVRENTVGATEWVEADQLVLVAPPGAAFTAAEPLIAGFGFTPEPAGGEGFGAREGVLVFSDDDPYDAEGSVAALAGPLGLRSVLLPGQAHINPDAGYGEWPAMLAWVLDPATPITARGQGPWPRP